MASSEGPRERSPEGQEQTDTRDAPDFQPSEVALWLRAEAEDAELSDIDPATVEVLRECADIIADLPDEVPTSAGEPDYADHMEPMEVSRQVTATVRPASREAVEAPRVDDDQEYRERAAKLVLDGRAVAVSLTEWARHLEASGIPKEKWRADSLRALQQPTEASEEAGALDAALKKYEGYVKRGLCDGDDGALIADNTLGIGDLAVGDLRRLRDRLRTPAAPEEPVGAEWAGIARQFYDTWARADVVDMGGHHQIDTAAVEELEALWAGIHANGAPTSRPAPSPSPAPGWIVEDTNDNDAPTQVAQPEEARIDDAARQIAEWFHTESPEGFENDRRHVRAFLARYFGATLASGPADAA